MKKSVIALLALFLNFGECFGQGHPITLGAFKLFHPTTLELEARTSVMLELQSGLQTSKLPLISSQSVRVQLVNKRLNVKVLDQGDRLVSEALADGVRGQASVYFLRVPRRISRTFWGKLEITPGEVELVARLEIPEEAATEQILRSEMTEGAVREALKAQAIVIRSYLRASPGRHRPEGFDFCDTTHCQFFKGWVERDDHFREAVASTTGQILTFRGELFQPLYAAACGGQTLSKESSGSGLSRYPYRSVSCHYCAAHPLYRWETTVDRGDLLQAIAKSQLAGISIDELLGRLAHPDEPGTSGADLKNQVRVLVGRRLGWNVIPSSRYSVDSSGNLLRIKGRGSGHNLGLCQAGAMELARRGRTAAGILDFYFPGCQVWLTASGSLLGIECVMS